MRRNSFLVGVLRYTEAADFPICRLDNLDTMRHWHNLELCDISKQGALLCRRNNLRPFPEPFHLGIRVQVCG